MTSFRKSCGPCNGRGYYGTISIATCKVCEGVGQFSLQGSPNDYTSCGPCNGRGYYGTISTATCKVCKGIGLVRIKLKQLSEFSDQEKQVINTNSVGIKITSLQNDIFLVHGSNHAVRDHLHIYLATELGLKVVVMAAGPHQGRTLPEKFEQMASRCKFAVFLLTADDEFTASDGKSIRRARQNVILEIGYFWGALGRQSSVAFLVENHPNMELPSDIQGIGWIPITHDLGETKLRLRQELQAAGLLS